MSALVIGSLIGCFVIIFLVLTYAVAAVAVGQHEERMRQLAKYERELALKEAQMAKPIREEVIGYKVEREGNDIVLTWLDKNDKKIQSYWMSDQAAAQLVSAIVSKFSA